MNLPGQYAQYVKESLEAGQLKYVKHVEIDLDKEKTMLRKTTKKVLIGQFDATKDWCTYSDMMKACTGFGFVLGVSVSLLVHYFL